MPAQNAFVEGDAEIAAIVAEERLALIGKIHRRPQALIEIAEKCGYTDYVYFSKKFKSVTGVAPRTYLADTFGHNKLP